MVKSDPAIGGRRISISRRWVAAVTAGTLLGALIGYLAGINHSSVTIRSCKAQAAPTQATAICSDGWAYAIPVDNVRWRDSNQTWHQAGRPACLPLGPVAVDRLTFATVDVMIDGMGWRPVVWVSC